MKRLLFYALMLFFAWGSLAESDPSRSGLQKQTVRITTILNPPYVIQKAISNGESNYTGFLVDILDEAGQYFPEFQYRIQIVKDGKYGALNKDGTWSGMIGEVINNEADVAIADLTITEARTKAIDFTVPFLTTGISMMVKRQDNLESLWPQTTSTSYIFLAVFSWEMWLCILVVLLAFSILYYLGEKFTGDEPQGGFLSKMGLSVGALTTGKNGISKKSMSVRFLLFIWKLFLFFTFGLYLSSLTTAMWTRLNTEEGHSLTYAKSPEIIVKEAMEKGYPKIVTIDKGATQAFFKNSEIPEYQIYGRKASNKEFYVSSTIEGIKKVKSGGYIFMSESTTNEYRTNRDCELEMLPQMINTRGYGMALRKDSRITFLLNISILRLQETGKMDYLKKKWWTFQQLQCSKNSPSASSPVKTSFSSLHPGDVCGLFYTVIGAAVLTILAIFTEFIFKRKRSVSA